MVQSDVGVSHIPGVQGFLDNYSMSVLPQLMGIFGVFWSIDETKKACKLLIYRLLFIFDDVISGELGIRTPGTFNSSTVFKTAAIDHSASSPGAKVQNRAEIASMMLSFFK